MVLLSIAISPMFSLAAQNYTDSTDIKQWSAIQNLYENTRKYYQENIDESSDDAIKKIAWDYGAKEEDIRAIIFENWKKSKCANFIKNMKEIKLNWDQISSADLQKCQDIIVWKYHSFTTNDMWKKDTQDALAWENIFSDWDDSNSPYDLLVDMKEISKILFKEEIEIKLWSIKFPWKWWSSAEGGSWDSWDKSWDNSSTWKDWKSWSSWKKTSNNKTDKKSQDKSSNEKAETETEKWEKEKKSWDKTEDDKHKKFYWKNPRLQLWNTCEINPNLYSNWYRKITNLSNDFVSASKKGWSEAWGSVIDSWSNANQYSKISFDTFIWDHIKWWELPWWIWSFMWNKPWAQTQKAMDTQFKKSWSAKSCFGWKILTICIKLVPSWPRWPLWWDERKRSLEGIVDKVLDTEKDMKEWFIVPAGHADESLWINYKHVKFDQIIAFNLVLNKKPVFPFKDKDKKEKEENKADTECDWVPRKFAAIYKNSNIWDCFIKENDKNKYLITNQQAVKPQERLEEKPDEQVEESSSKWLFSSISIYSDFNKMMLKTMGDIKTSTKQQRNSSQTMLDISQN